MQRTIRFSVLTTAAVATAFTAALSPALAFAETSTPPLPNAGNRCIGPSPTVVNAVPWAQQQLGPGRVWELTKGAGVTVAVLDSGVSANAPALAGAVLPGSDVIAGGQANSDCTGHGTFVAGVIAARPVPGVGFAGMAPNATVLPIRVVSSNDLQAQTTADTLAAAIRAAVDAGASVVDISVEAAEDSPALQAAVRQAESKNVLLVAAIDDRPTQSGQRRFPSSYPTVLAVNGISQSGPSNIGTSAVRVDLAAPGAQIVSVGPSGDGHYVGDGAMYAAPFVAGTAALVRSRLPGLSAAQVRNRLEATADRTGATLPDPLYGYGVIDPYLAVTAILPGETGVAAVLPGATVPEIPQAKPVDNGPAIAAFALFGGVVAVLVLAIGIGLTARGGRTRNWRSAATRPEGE